MSIHKEINNRLRAGALVVLVEDTDEALALESAKVAARQFLPIQVASYTDKDVQEILAKHKTGEGTLILCDFLRAYGSNPVAVRMIREIALQQPRADKKPMSRLILVEVPGVEVPASLRGDIEYLIPKMPDVKALRAELDDFVRLQDIKLPGNGENRHAIASSVSGLSRHEAMRLFSRCWVDKQALDTVWLRKEKATRVSERLGGALTFVETDTPGVGGLGYLKSWLGARKDAFGSEKAKEFGLPEPKGVILLGSPGTGKSLTAKTVAREWGVPLLRLDAGKLFGSLVGQSESQTRQAIEAAEACSPCVLWIDEIEKGLSSGGLDGGTSQRVFGTMLTWLQEKEKPVFVVATANAVEGLPPELLRKGRFDEIFFVDLPTLNERLEITQIHLKRRNRLKIDPKQIAAATEGFSGAEIEQAIIEGMFTAFDQQRDVTVGDILAAVRGTTPLSKTMEVKIEALRTWAKGRAKLASAPAQVAISDTVQTRRSGIVQ